MRLINGDELADMLSRVRQRLDPKIYKTATEFYTRDEMLLNLEQMVRIAPTIDPVKHGRWKNRHSPWAEGGSVMVCSCCEKSIATLGEKMKFCPNCGAKMDADEERG